MTGDPQNVAPVEEPSEAKAWICGWQGDGG